MERIKLLVLAVLAIGGRLLGSESGFVAPRRSLPLAWTAGVLVAAAVLLSPGSARAVCYPGYYEMGQQCTPSGCANLCETQHGCYESQCVYITLCHCWQN